MLAQELKAQTKAIDLERRRHLESEMPAPPAMNILCDL
jgi:hypothetical protein